MQIKRNQIIISVLIIIITLTSCSQHSKSKDLESILDDFMTKQALFGFSGGVLVEKDGKIILSKGYGFANNEYLIPFTDSTIIDIASVTKGFTATAILQLYDQSKLDINDKLDKYFDNIPIDKEGITIKQLLSNSSGLGEFLAAPSNITRDELVKKILSKPFEGTVDKWYYSNEGFSILAAIVEKVSGMSYEEYISENFIIPLGMTHTGFFGDKKWDDKYLGHSYNREKDYGSFANNINKWNEKGSGNMASSVADIYKWIKASMENKFLKMDTYKDQFTKYVELNKNLGYGYGWFIGNTERGTRFFRLGGNNTPAGITIEVRVFPEENAMYILFCNEMIDEVGLVRPIRSELENIMFENGYKNSLSGFDLTSIKKTNDYVRMVSFKNGTIIEPYLNKFLIKTENQEVVNSITTPDKDRKALLSELNDKAKKLFKQLLDGTYEDKELRDYYWNTIGLKDFKVLCTVPVDNSGTNATFVRAWTPDGQFVYRCMWNGDEFFYINDKTNKLPLWKIVRTSNGFVGYDLVLKKKFEVSINKNDFKIMSKGIENVFEY